MIRPKSVNIAEAKARLAELVQRAAQGEEIIISRNGRPQARLVPLPEKPERVPGRGAGDWWIADDFDDPLPEDELRLWEGEVDHDDDEEEV